MKLINFKTQYALVLIVSYSVSYALPRKIVIRNDSDILQKAWITSNYTLTKKTVPYLKKERTEIVTREIRPHTSYTYGSRDHEFDRLEIKVSTDTSAINPPVSARTIKGLAGVKSIITIGSGNIPDKVEVRESFKKQVQEIMDNTKEKTKEVARSLKQGSREKLEQARLTAASTAEKVREKAHDTKEAASELLHEGKENAQGWFTRIKLWWYERWCSFKARLSCFFMRQPAI